MTTWRLRGEAGFFFLAGYENRHIGPDPCWKFLTYLPFYSLPLGKYYEEGIDKIRVKVQLNFVDLNPDQLSEILIHQLAINLCWGPLTLDLSNSFNSLTPIPTHSHVASILAMQNPCRTTRRYDPTRLGNKSMPPM